MNKRFLSKNWWDFKGTISGTQYFLRGFWGLLFILPGALITGSAIKSSVIMISKNGKNYNAHFGDNVQGFIDFMEVFLPNAGGFGLFLLLLGYLATLWLNLSTTNKRLNAITPDQKVFGWIWVILFNTAMSFYLTFKNAIPKKPENGTVFVPAHWRTARDGKKSNNLSAKKA